MASARSTPIEQLLNLGPATAKWLAAVGIATRGDLEETGVIEAFQRLRAAGFKPSLNAAYAMAGALSNTHWTKLPCEERSRLILAIDALGAAGELRSRCPWCGDDPLYVAYHDEEWGVPKHDDRQLFELLILEGAQAGLSWLTILRKRENYRRAFDGFDPARIAGYDEARRGALLADAGIVRNRLKIDSAISNARAYLELVQRHGSFARWLWGFVDGRALRNAWESIDQVPARSSQSDAMSKALAGAGFRFVGSTICYAFMQAAGMVDDHLVCCFRHGQTDDGP